MSIRTENLKSRKLTCLRCGKEFWTDRCHRICKKCAANITDDFIKPLLEAEGISLLGDLPLAEELGFDEDAYDEVDDRELEEIT